MKNLVVPLILVVLLSCSKDDGVTLPTLPPKPEDPLKDLPDLGPVRFDAPAVGQRSYYISFDSHYNLPSGDVTFKTKTDTLVVAITAKQAGDWTLTEFLTPGSSSLTQPAEPYVNILRVDSDSVYFITDYSKAGISYIFSGRKRALPLALFSDPTPLNPEILPSFEHSTAIFKKYTVNYKRSGTTFSHLNNFFDYHEMATDGWGFMYVYGAPYGLVRWTWISAWTTDKADGWDLITQ